MEDKHEEALEYNNAGKNESEDLHFLLEKSKAKVPRDNDEVVKKVQTKLF